MRVGVSVRARDSLVHQEASLSYQPCITSGSVLILSHYYFISLLSCVYCAPNIFISVNALLQVFFFI